MRLRSYYNELKLKAVIAGVIALLTFGIIANIIDFGLMGIIPTQSFSFANGERINDVVSKGIMKYFPLYLVCSLLTRFIWYVPAGYIAAFMAKRAYIFHSLIIGIIGSIFTIYSHIMNDAITGITIFWVLLFFDIFLAISFSTLGGSLCKKIVKGKNRDDHN